MEPILKRLLFIDDEAPIIELVQEYFQSENFQVTTAISAMDGLKILKTEVVDLVVCDIRMPEISGPEALLEFNKIGLDIPFLFYSAYASNEDAKSHDFDGATAVINKTDFDGLKTAIHDAIAAQ